MRAKKEFPRLYCPNQEVVCVRLREREECVQKGLSGQIAKCLSLFPYCVVSQNGFYRTLLPTVFEYVPGMGVGLV